MSHASLAPNELWSKNVTWKSYLLEISNGLYSICANFKNAASINPLQFVDAFGMEQSVRWIHLKKRLLIKGCVILLIQM